MSKRIIRTLNATDVEKNSSHGSEPPIGDPVLVKKIDDFFEGKNSVKEFIDVRTQKKYRMHMTDYNGTVTPYRIASIRKYRAEHNLDVGDEIIWEKIEDYNPPLYFIDYNKKSVSVSIAGISKNQGLIDQEKLDALIRTLPSDCIIGKSANGEYEIKGTLNNKTGIYRIRIIQGVVSIEFEKEIVKIKGKNVYDLIFSKKGIELQETRDWIFQDNVTSWLLEKYNQESYEKEDTEILLNIDTSELVKMQILYTASPVQKEKLKPSGDGKSTYPRKKSVSVKALKRAGNQCESNKKHRSFLRKNSHIKYMEPHHLIPLQFHEQFAWSLDVEANIVSLCSECHNQIHYGDGKKIITRLWKQREKELDDAGLGKLVSGEKLTLEKLLGFYGIG